MVMEFDQYLQPCDVSESPYLTAYGSSPPASKHHPPRIDILRTTADGVQSKSAGPPSASLDAEPAVGDGASPRENRCTWECSFDNDDAETILTSPTVSLIKFCIHINIFIFRIADRPHSVLGEGVE